MISNAMLMVAGHSSMIFVLPQVPFSALSQFKLNGLQSELSIAICMIQDITTADIVATAVQKKTLLGNTSM